MKFIVILFLLFTSIYTLAQQSDSQLAYTYYQAKEYDKAAENIASARREQLENVRSDGLFREVRHLFRLS